MKLKDQLVTELKQNEHILQVVALDDLMQEYKDTMKTGSNFVAPIIDSRSAIKIINEFGIKTNKAVIKTYAGKQYIIFKGYPGARKVLTGTRYLTTNPKVVRMAIGPKGIAKSVKGGFILTVVLSVGIEVFDYFIKDTSTLSNLLGTITGDLIKIGLSAIAGTVAAMIVGGSAILGSIAAAPLIAAIGVGIIAGAVLNAIDEKYGATKALIKAYEEIGVNLDAIAEEYRRGMRAIDKDPTLIRCLFAPCGNYY